MVRSLGDTRILCALTISLTRCSLVWRQICGGAAGAGRGLKGATIFDVETGFIHTSAGDCAAEVLWLSVFWAVIVLEASNG